MRYSSTTYPDQPYTEETSPSVAYDPLTHGACPDIYTGTPNQATAEAQSCIATYKDTKIALVTNGISRAQAQRVATDAELTILNATGGLVNPLIYVLPTTSSTERRVKTKLGRVEKTGAPCLDESNSSKWVSTIADNTMQLHRYAAIISLNSMNSCTPAGGIANSTDRRHADVYYNENKQPHGRTDGVATAITHEFGHLRLRP